MLLHKNCCISVNFPNFSLKLSICILDTYIFQNITKLKNRFFPNFTLFIAFNNEEKVWHKWREHNILIIHFIFLLFCSSFFVYFTWWLSTEYHLFHDFDILKFAVSILRKLIICPFNACSNYSFELLRMLLQLFYYNRLPSPHIAAHYLWYRNID